MIYQGKHQTGDKSWLMPLKRHRLKIGTVGNGVEENKGLVRRTENDRSHNIRVLYLGLFAWVKREISERKTFFL